MCKFKVESLSCLSLQQQAHLQQAVEQGVNRRQLIYSLVASGFASSSAVSLINFSAEAAAAKPENGGKLRIAPDLHGPSDTMDPRLFTSSIDSIRGRLTYNNLVRLTDDLSIEPELAERFESNTDATEWTFRLRKDVRWHDGSKLNADDVRYSMNRHLGKDSKSVVKTLFNDVKEWKKEDDYTIIAILERPNAEFPNLLGTQHFNVIKSDTSEFLNPIGTGPFRLNEFKPGVRSVHKYFGDYWNGGRPYLDEIEVFAVTDPIARVNALVAGDVHLISNVDPKSIPRLLDSDRVGIFTVPTGAYADVVIRHDRGPGKNNPDFIQGMKYLQRRERILKAIQKNIGTLGNDQPIGPAYGVAHCQDLDVRSFDPDRAKSLLKKSGVDAAEIQVAEVAPGLTDSVLLLQRECSKVGFDLKVKRVPNDGYWSAVWNKAPMHVSSWNMRPTASMMMSIAYKSDAPWNESAWKNEKFDKLLSEARAQIDQGKRQEINCELQGLISNNAGTLIPTHRALVDGKSNAVRGLSRVPLGSFGSMAYPEHISLASSGTGDSGDYCALDEKWCKNKNQCIPKGESC